MQDEAAGCQCLPLPANASGWRHHFTLQDICYIGSMKRELKWGKLHQCPPLPDGARNGSIDLRSSMCRPATKPVFSRSPSVTTCAGRMNWTGWRRESESSPATDALALWSRFVHTDVFHIIAYAECSGRSGRDARRRRSRAGVRARHEAAVHAAFEVAF